MTNHPNRSPNKQLLDELIAYELDRSNPADGRRVIRNQRLTLIAAMQGETGRAAALRALAAVKHPQSNQGQMQIADLRRRIAGLPTPGHLAACIADARNALKAWI